MKIVVLIEDSKTLAEALIGVLKLYDIQLQSNKNVKLKLRTVLRDIKK